MTAEQRYRRALRRFTVIVLGVGYTVGWCWRGVCDRRRFYDPR